MFRRGRLSRSGFAEEKNAYILFWLRTDRRISLFVTILSVLNPSLLSNITNIFLWFSFKNGERILPNSTLNKKQYFSIFTFFLFAHVFQNAKFCIQRQIWFFTQDMSMHKNQFWLKIHRYNILLFTYIIKRNALLCK